MTAAHGDLARDISNVLADVRAAAKADAAAARCDSRGVGGDDGDLEEHFVPPGVGSAGRVLELLLPIANAHGFRSTNSSVRPRAETVVSVLGRKSAGAALWCR